MKCNLKLLDVPLSHTMMTEVKNMPRNLYSQFRRKWWSREHKIYLYKIDNVTSGHSMCKAAADCDYIEVL